MYIENEIVYGVVFLWVVYGLHTLIKIRDERRRENKKMKDIYNVQGYYRRQFYPKENIHKTIYVEGHSRNYSPHDNVRGEEE